MAYVNDDDAVWSKAVCYLLEELDGGQMGWNIRQAIGIHADDGVLPIGVGEEISPVRHNHVEVGFGHPEVLLAHSNDLGIDLDAIDRQRTVRSGVLLGDSAWASPINATLCTCSAMGRGMKTAQSGIVPGARGAQLVGQ